MGLEECLTEDRKMLEQQLTEAQARIARLEETASLAAFGKVGSEWVQITEKSLDNLDAVIDESPRQSLDHIRREAMEEVVREIIERFSDEHGGISVASSRLREMPLPIDKEEG